MIDRNPKYFGYILDFLRMLGTEQKFHIPDSVDRNEFINEVCLLNSIQELNFFQHWMVIWLMIYNLDVFYLNWFDWKKSKL